MIFLNYLLFQIAKIFLKEFNYFDLDDKQNPLHPDWLENDSNFYNDICEEYPPRLEPKLKNNYNLGETFKYKPAAIGGFGSGFSPNMFIEDG